MRTIKTYFKGAPFYNAFHGTWPPELHQYSLCLLWRQIRCVRRMRRIRMPEPVVQIGHSV